jgi:hypothetical protein
VEVEINENIQKWRESQYPKDWLLGDLHNKQEKLTELKGKLVNIKKIL